MVVDDDPTVLTAILRALQSAGYESYGFATVAAAKAAKGPWDLILADIRLPDGEGREVLEYHKVRRSIITSGHADGDLQKPFTITELLNMVRSMLPRESFT